MVRRRQRFGFIIQDEGGSDLYVNAKVMKKANLHAVEPGDAVSFNIRERRQGLAEDAAVLEEQPAAALVSDRLTGILPKPKSFSDTEDEFEREWGLRRG